MRSNPIDFGPLRSKLVPLVGSTVVMAMLVMIMMIAPGVNRVEAGKVYQDLTGQRCAYCHANFATQTPTGNRNDMTRCGKKWWDNQKWRPGDNC